MANLNGHEAGNGGYSQGGPTGTAPVLDPTDWAGAGDGCFAYRASPRPYGGGDERMGVTARRLALLGALIVLAATPLRRSPVADLQ